MRTSHLYKTIITPDTTLVEAQFVAACEAFDSFGELIYEGRNTLRSGTIGGVAVTIKRFARPNVVNRWAYVTVRSSKAMRSFVYAGRLAALGIATPKPFAALEWREGWALGYSYYISATSALRHEIREFWTRPTTPLRADILEAFGRFTAAIHRAGVLHVDYSAGNVLYGAPALSSGAADDARRPSSDAIAFELLDLNRMRFCAVSEAMGYRNFERLWLPDDCFRIIARAYAEAMGYDGATAEQRILHHAHRFMNKKCSSRKMRATKDVATCE